MNPIIKDMITLFQNNGWNKAKFALNEQGEPVHPRSPEAVSFCLVGAFARVQTKYSYNEHIKAEQAIRNHMPPIAIPTFNDTYLNSKEEVITFLEEVLYDTNTNP